MCRFADGKTSDERTRTLTGFNINKKGQCPNKALKLSTWKQQVDEAMCKCAHERTGTLTCAKGNCM